MMILVIIICYFAGLLLIAHITGHKGGSNAAFFKGENKSPWYIVSFGMIGATISGVTFVSVPGMVRGMDMTYMQTVFGFFFGYMIVAHILLPLYYGLWCLLMRRMDFAIWMVRRLSALWTVRRILLSMRIPIILR